MHGGESIELRTNVSGDVDVSDLVARLSAHRLYDVVDDAFALSIFMRAHVFAVWDFQCLLKALQRRLTCVDVVWLPTPDPEARRLLNRVVLDEESDATPDGRHLSHFETYVEAMDAAGADRGPIDAFIAALRRGATPHDALALKTTPDGAAAFVASTLRDAAEPETHRVAAAFAYGREEAIPAMFQKLVERLADASPKRFGPFRHYLERHIGCDAEEHGPAARRVVARLCGGDPRRLLEARETARRALEARAAFWDAIATTIESERRRLGRRVAKTRREEGRPTCSIENAS
jgi:hypothetical protein